MTGEAYQLDRLFEKFAQVFKDEWRTDAACSNVPDADVLFFDPDHEQEAKAICATCPVRIECLDDALFYEDESCVRGGLNAKERITLAQFRKRTNPYIKFDTHSPMLSVTDNLNIEGFDVIEKKVQDL